MIRWVAWLLASSAAAVACEATGQRLNSENQDAPEVHMVVDEIPLAQPFSLQISICDDIAVETVRVDATMPAHQHGMNYVSKVTELGDGLFRVDDMLFHMPGLWELQVDVGFGGEPVSYTSEVELK